MPQHLKIATAQFENHSADKAYNLSVIDRLTARAAQAGADAIAFHECSVTGYTFAQHLSKEELWEVAEPIPSGPSVRTLIDIARRHGIAVLTGLFERGDDGEVYKAHVCVDGDGLKAKYRKLHPFINPHIKPGNEYVVFDLKGWKCGILICYDNNIIENVRATALLGAEIIFMPHVTMCTPSTRPGAGFVDPALWANKLADPTSLRAEFDGLKGRAWLMKWLPARAYDNGIYAVFSNPIGMDGYQLKNGCSMVIDPFGDIIAECRSFDDEIAVATCVHRNIAESGGHRYRAARKPELYASILGAGNRSEQRVAWMSREEKRPNLNVRTRQGPTAPPRQISRHGITADEPIPANLPFAAALRRLLADRDRYSMQIGIDPTTFYSEVAIELHDFVDGIIYRFVTEEGTAFLAYDISNRHGGIYREVAFDGTVLQEWPLAVVTSGEPDELEVLRARSIRMMFTLGRS